MKQPNILIVEDEFVTRNSLKNIFCGEGYNVFEAASGDEMSKILEHNEIDLIIMDINLPGKNGFILAREIRRTTKIALIFLTGSNDESDKILGLEIGADDYITKPFNPRELTIRARNLLARTLRPAYQTNEKISRYQFNGWTLELNNRTLVDPNGTVIKMPRSEFRLLQHFCENNVEIQSREKLLYAMTGRELKPYDRTVDVTIRRLRKHFEDFDPNSEIILTIHGEGYRFCSEVEIS